MSTNELLFQKAAESGQVGISGVRQMGQSSWVCTAGLGPTQGGPVQTGLDFSKMVTGWS